MVKVKQTITLELESSGQKVTVDLQEARDIIKSLSRFVERRSDSNNIIESSGRTIRKGRKANTKTKREGRGFRKAKSAQNGKALSMSETKRQEIIDHVNKQLSARPQTLSALLKGVSYVPNYLPAIRKMIETKGNINREIIGKRIYYSRKSSSASTQKQTRSVAITP